MSFNPIKFPSKSHDHPIEIPLNPLSFSQEFHLQAERGLPRAPPLPPGRGAPGAAPGAAVGAVETAGGAAGDVGEPGVYLGWCLEDLDISGLFFHWEIKHPN